MRLTLVVMAAGMGSRYGGLKQIDPVGPNGEIIMDYSVYDAMRAGFDRVVFVIKRENREAFEDAILRYLPKDLEVKIAYQELEDVPDPARIPEGRVKPWGTAHAVRAAREYIDGPFVAINADDYYGPEAFRKVADFLRETGGKPGSYAMVAYPVRNTLTENGSVSRGICTVEDGRLIRVVEHTKIFKDGENAKFTEDGERFEPLSGDAPCSMNFWGFQQDFIDAIEEGFSRFLDEEVPKNPLKAEYYLPTVVTSQIESGKATVSVLSSEDKWFGVTYPEDKRDVVEGIRKLIDLSVYPHSLRGTNMIK